YGGYGVVQVDKQKARLFLFHLGELSEADPVMGEEVRRIKHGTASSMPGARSGGGSSSGRHTQEVVDRNMKEIVAGAVDFLEQHHVRRVLIGGTEENVTMFRNLLPKSVQSLVMATFPMAMAANEAELLEKVLEIGDNFNGKREKHLVDDLISIASRKDNQAVMGVEPTLQAVNDGRVTTVVISEGFHQPAFQCAQCARLTVLPGKVCTVCGGKYYNLPDVREALVKMVMGKGGDVVVVKPSPAFDASGNIGAFTRF
ncbi:MAG TPA: hypothetical protein VFF68_11875, partial [Anaerolineaceae bacterium]|nr:hypothetical protein [Anaerolineaceae bacterium]